MIRVEDWQLWSFLLKDLIFCVFKLICLSNFKCCLLQLLWISDDGVPDLGGINDESTCFVDEVSFWQMHINVGRHPHLLMA